MLLLAYLLSDGSLILQSLSELRSSLGTLIYSETFAGCARRDEAVLVLELNGDRQKLSRDVDVIGA